MLRELSPRFLKELLRTADVPRFSGNNRCDCTCVFFLIYYKDHTPFLLAILKADTPGYPWRNQVALPGGHIDKEDSSPLDAAYRELDEETGISRHEVDFIRSLGHFQTIRHKDIEVFVGIWEGNPEEIIYDSKEISKVLAIPFETLLKTHVSNDYRGRIPGVGELLYPVEDIVIWGVTARILHSFFELLLIQYDQYG